MLVIDDNIAAYIAEKQSSLISSSPREMPMRINTSDKPAASRAEAIFTDAYTGVETLMINSFDECFVKNHRRLISRGIRIILLQQRELSYSLYRFHSSFSDASNFFARHLYHHDLEMILRHFLKYFTYSSSSMLIISNCQLRRRLASCRRLFRFK